MNVIDKEWHGFKFDFSLVISLPDSICFNEFKCPFDKQVWICAFLHGPPPLLRRSKIFPLHTTRGCMREWAVHSYVSVWAYVRVWKRRRERACSRILCVRVCGVYLPKCFWARFKTDEIARASEREREFILQSGVCTQEWVLMSVWVSLRER